mmetsp:Transcript_14297/g.23304  ORF Transcript_14297/g.23304 Transcript_14297/m.23304 type:complete len:188 (-) Transcript_14297:2266-2829(-)|eukprot:scaffold1151_cov144-Skeletonema_menzelii.AAC.9
MTLLLHESLVAATAIGHTAAAFTTPYVRRYVHHPTVHRHNPVAVVAMPLFGSRIGGRRAKKPKVKKEEKITNNDGPFALIRQVGIPILLVTLFLRLLFGNLFGGGSNVVYYSSTVYQSTTYSRDGNIETKRKESFESNIPGLVERAKERSQGNNDNSALRGSYYDTNAFKEELLDAEDEINSIFREW